ncbi:hypothetical protein BU17DRAFT_62728 [Hysterangium stoloniferum]|nr:hypothetical protein BU17DRAFT_62728 [Hysterangium stoloniferum]
MSEQRYICRHTMKISNHHWKSNYAIPAEVGEKVIVSQTEKRLAHQNLEGGAAPALSLGCYGVNGEEFPYTQEKLNSAVFHLGLCPNPQCWNKSQMRIWRNKPQVIASHLRTHEECRPFSPRTVSKEEEECQEIDEEGVEGMKVKIAKRTGYKEMGKLLGFVSPLPPKAPDVLPVGRQPVGRQLFNGRLH